LSSDALNQLNISELKFDIDYSIRKKDPREKKKKSKAKYKQNKKGIDIKKSSKRKVNNI
ncbi:3912_t:CDS:1, partial [Cetraspora pellucida]